MSAAGMFSAQIANNIRESGCHIWGVGVNEEENFPSFTYTTGLAERELPEFIIVGFNPAQAAGIINALVKKLSDDERGAYNNTEVVELFEGFKVAILDARASVRDRYTIQTGQYYGHEDYQVQQVVIPDEEGRLPNNPKHVYHNQRLLIDKPLPGDTIEALTAQNVTAH